MTATSDNTMAMTAAVKPRSASILASLRELGRHRELLILFTQKELKLKYKGTALGFLWSLVNPLLLMAVYAIVFSQITRASVKNYPIFLLSGMLPWNMFTIAISTASMTIVGNGNLIRRVNFPREFLPLSAVIASLVNLVLSMFVLLGFTLVFRQPLGLPLVMLPVLLILELMFTSGVCLALAGLMVYFRDVENLIMIFITVMFFATPIIYPLSAIHHQTIHDLMQLNPMAWLVTSYQSIWHDNTWPNPIYLLAFTVASVLSLGLGLLAFRRLEVRFAEEV